MFNRRIHRLRHIFRRPLQQRRFSQEPQVNNVFYEMPRVRYVWPVIWSSVTIFGIYVTGISLELNQAVNKYEKYRASQKRNTPPLSYELLETIRLTQAQAQLDKRQDADLSLFTLTSTKAVESAWNSLTGPEKAAWTAIGINTTLYLPSKVSPAVAQALFHLPAANRNWTLLTSTFGHGSPLHLLFNMYVLQNFALPVTSSKTFQGSTYHSTCFYLSAGILSALAYHLQSAVKPVYRMVPCLGASGAIYAMVGVFGMSYPDAGIGIIFLPFSFPASQALMGIAAFELYGTIFGTGLGLAHVSHLAGLAFGAGYVYWDLGSAWRAVEKGVVERKVESDKRKH